MEKFIQRVLDCTDIKKNDDLISAFPIIRVNIDGNQKNLLVFRFNRLSIPNYLVIGMFKDNVFADRASFVNWLKDLYTLILSNPKELSFHEYHALLDKVKHSICFKSLLYTQEGFDLINGKEHFTNTGLISRTVEMDIQVMADKSIEFSRSVKFNLNNQFLDGDFFREYEDYQQKYFLNFYEYHSMSYLNVISFIKINAYRLGNLLGNVPSIIGDEWLEQNLGYLIQMLDSYMTNVDMDSKRKR